MGDLAEEMGSMFSGATKFQQNLCGWNFNVAGDFLMTNMFASTGCPTANVNGDFEAGADSALGALCCTCTATPDEPTTTYTECLIAATKSQHSFSRMNLRNIWFCHRTT